MLLEPHDHDARPARLGARLEKPASLGVEAQPPEDALPLLAAVGRMTAGIAHDFRNILTVIDAALNCLERRCDRPDLMRTYVLSARQGVRSGVDLTSYLLRCATQEVGDVELRDVNALVADITPLLKLAIGSATRIDFELGTELPKALVEKSRFAAALLNLVANARDAMPAGGRVQISTDRLVQPSSDNETAAKSYVRVTVHDRGHGLSMDALHRMFTPLYTTKGINGTGLGLPQVCAFVKSVNGRMRVASKPGVGTSVSLLLPTAADEPFNADQELVEFTDAIRAHHRAQ
jgi:signal transduction histidine kinase